MKPRLLCILEHPTQYDPPLWSSLARRARVDVAVWYAESSAPSDVELRREVKWNELGSALTVVRNRELSQKLSMLERRPTAILTPGWTRRRTWWASRAARAAGIPLVLPSDKTLNEPSPRQPIRTVLTMAHAVRARLFDGFLTTGTLGQAQLRSLGVPPERIATGLYPVDVEAWGRNLAACRHLTERMRQTMSEHFVVLAVSKLNRRENPLLVIEGFARLQKQSPRARLLFVGDGPMRTEVETRAAKLGIAKCVHFAGYVPYTDLAGYYGAADAFVHVPAKEPWGISVAEAMACRLPVVASSTVGAAADLVITGRTGFLVPPDDPDAIAAALRSLSEGTSARDTGQRARSRVEIVDVEAAAGSLESLVESLVEPARWTPLSEIFMGDLLNRWGRWSR